MSLPVILHRTARKEFDEAADWYDQQRSGLGAEFIAEIEHLLEQIGENPMQYAIVHKDVREALVRRFPYAIYYQAEAEQIVVLAVIHTSRDPSIWQNRA